MVFKTGGKSEAAASKATVITSSVPLSETVTSERDQNSNSEPSTLPPKISDSNPPYHEVSDKIWTQSNELLDKVKSNSSLNITKVSTGSLIDKHILNHLD